MIIIVPLAMPAHTNSIALSEQKENQQIKENEQKLEKIKLVDEIPDSWEEL